MSEARFRIRFSPRDGTLRSVDLAPNGILGVAIPDDVASLIVSPSGEPSYVFGIQRAELAEGGISIDATPVAAPDAAAACEGELELKSLYAITCRAMLSTSAYYLEAQRFDLVESHLELVREVAGAIEAELGKREIPTNE